MWNGSPRLARFAEVAFRVSTIAACVGATVGPATAQPSQRVTVTGQVLPRCWAAPNERRTAAAARCSSRSARVEIALDEPGDGQPRPCMAKAAGPDTVDCARETPPAPRRVTVTPRS